MIHRVAVLGVGVMGERHVRAFGQLGGRFRVVALHDTRGEHLARAATSLAIPAFDDADAAIEAADVVVIATPIATHRALSLRALAAGRHVLVEKPIAASAEEADELVRAAARSDARLFVGHSERFNPVVRALAQAIFGEELLEIELERKAVTSSAPEQGALLNLGVHDIDLVAHLGVGPVHLVTAAGRTARRAGRDGQDPTTFDVRAQLELRAGGAHARVSVDSAAADRVRTVRARTREATYLGNLWRPALLRRSGSELMQALPLAPGEPLVLQAEALADALDGAEDVHLATGIDGARAIALAEDAAQRIHRAAAVAGATDEARPSQSWAAEPERAEPAFG